MISPRQCLTVFLLLALLTCPASTLQRDPLLSLWGTVADFTSGCSHWRLQPRVFVPALQELTVCLNLQLKAPAASSWTAFMYRRPAVQRAELGLGWRLGRLVVWLFGAEWTTPPVDLRPTRWHSVCLSWSHTKDRPALYIDGSLMDITPDFTSSSSSCCKLAPNGTLTLGAAHKLVNGKIQVLPKTGLSGKISLFRLWGRERSEQEVTSLNCAEGDLVTWERDAWDTRTCAALTDSTLRCEWSFYRVGLTFAIMRFDGNNTDLHAARHTAQRWLREVLPTGYYIHSVSVFGATRSAAEIGLFNTSDEAMLVSSSRIAFNRFDSRVHVTVLPRLDVAAVQHEMYTDLLTSYTDPSGQLRLMPSPYSINITPVEKSSTTTVSPTDTTSPAAPSSSSSSSSSTSTITSPPPTSAAAATTVTRVPVNISVLFFEVKVNVSITGGFETERILSTWLNSSLPYDIMTVLDLQLLPEAHRRIRRLQANISTSEEVSVGVSRASCVFQVQVLMSLTDVPEMEEQIRNLLLTPYNQDSVSIATEDVQISRILVFNCNAATQQTLRGLFEWPATSGGSNATRPCPKIPRRNASRHCKLGLSTQWLAADLQDCPLVVETIPDLNHINVTAGNSLDMLEMIESLLRNRSALSHRELDTLLDILADVVDLSVVTQSLGQALINIISNILDSDSYLLPFTNMILNITDAVGDSMVDFKGSCTMVAPALAVSVVDVVPEQFASLTFGVSSDGTGSKPEIFINRYHFNSTVAFISLPSVLQQSFPQTNQQIPPRIQFQFYAIPELFKSSQKGRILNSCVVSASVTNATAPIRDLDEEVKVTLRHLQPNDLHMDIQCVYWNFNKNNGRGGWDGYGCRKYNSSSEYTTCLCDHLTHFGILMDVSRTPVDPVHQQILTIITYIGCGVSSLFLGITVLTYTAFEKLRRDYPSQILINLSLALLGLELVFLLNSWLSSWGLSGVCVAVASMLHYFLLASFTWMGLEAVNMYFALVKVFNVYVPSYILKFCVLGWGIPLVICVLVLIVNREAYGMHFDTDTHISLEPLDNSNAFCWLQDDVTFYVSVVAFALLVFLFNIAVFVVVLIQLRHMRANSPARTRRGLMHDLKGVASLTMLLGLTWTVGFFTWGPARVVLLYLFSVLNTLQGIFIFLFHCLMKENVRKQWRIHLCFGRFRLEECSEWSNSASVRVVAKTRSNPPRPSVPSVHSYKSNSTDSTSASSDSSRRDSSCRRPNLGLFVNSLALPRAQRSASGALLSQRGMNLTPGWRNHLLTQQD